MEIYYLADRREAISEIAKWYFEEWGKRAGDSSAADTRKRLHAYLNRKQVPLLVMVVQENEIQGVAQLKFHEMDIYPDKEYWLGGVYVPPRHRGKNVATRLVRHMIEIADSLGIGTLFLQTEQLDGGLYARLGWRPVEQVHYRGQDVLVMKLRLNRTGT